jgi:hypothetical protein
VPTTSKTVQLPDAILKLTEKHAKKAKAGNQIPTYLEVERTDLG